MFVIVDVNTKEWFTMHGFKPHFTNNKTIRWEQPDQGYADLTHYQLITEYFPERELEVQYVHD